MIMKRLCKLDVEERYCDSRRITENIDANKKLRLKSMCRKKGIQKIQDNNQCHSGDPMTLKMADQTNYINV